MGIKTVQIVECDYCFEEVEGFWASTDRTKEEILDAMKLCGAVAMPDGQVFHSACHDDYLLDLEYQEKQPAPSPSNQE